MKLKSLLVVSVLATSGIAVADTYQSEISASATRVDRNGFSSNLNNYAVNGRYYFNAVDTTNVPLEEAAFLGKNSAIYAGTGWGKSFSFFPDNGQVIADSERDVNFYNAGAAFYIPESFLYVAGGVSQYKVQSRSVGDMTVPGYTDNNWYTSIGITPVDGLIVSTYYNHDQGYDLNVHSKYVTDIGDGQFVNLEASLADTDGGSDATIGGDFYFDTSLSVGGEVRHTQARGDDFNEYTFRTRKFFTEQFSGELSYTDAKYGNQVVAGVSLRF